MLGRSRRYQDIEPDEIFLDSTNLLAVDTAGFDAQMERPVASGAVIGIIVVFAIVLTIFGGRAFSLQVAKGATYAEISRDNTIESWPLFSTRGLVYDRNGKELAWNEAPLSAVMDSLDATTTEEVSTTTPYALRHYISDPGFSIVLGFLRYPKADKNGSWWRESYAGMSGLELQYDSALQGKNGSTMLQRDAYRHIVMQNITTPPEPGQDLHLSIDADVQSHLYQILSQHARDNGFTGGAAVIIDVRTGQLLAITSFPQYDDQDFTNGDTASISAASKDPATPMLDRAVGGLYAPGSIVKPIFAAAALNEHLISPDKQIFSSGAITIPNPYDANNPSIFHDWTAHGWIDMRTALAVSSDEYFYTIGGGYGDQKGLGISKIDEYAKRFGLGSPTGIDLPGEQDGVIPSPQWKTITFPNDPIWRLGDTYHTAIGQYGFQITPVQAVRYIAAIANGGTLYTPHLVASSTPQGVSVGIPDSDLQIVREGMRMAVTSTRGDATVKALAIAGIAIAAKTGTAQIGMHNEAMNSWSVGFWPADHPKYAYAVVLEHAPAGTLSGAAPGMNPFFYWLIANHPEYVN